MTKLDGLQTSLKDCKIIYVEDNRSMRGLVYEVLKSDFNIAVLSTVEEAYKLIQEEEIALVLADHHMEPRTGIDFLQQLHSEFPQIKRVLITGDKSSDLIFNAVKDGRIHGFFHKPLDFSKLRQELQEYLQDYQDHRQQQIRNRALQEDITKLREALYQSNSRIYHAFSSLSKGLESDVDHKISSLFVSKLGKIRQVWENLIESSENNVLFEELYLLLEELIILSDEFKTQCFSLWLTEMKLVLKIYENVDTPIKNYISELKGKIPEYAHNSCKIELKGIIDDLIILKTGKDAPNSKGKLTKIFSNLLSQTQMEITKLEIITDQADIKVDPKQNLGYILVVHKQSTVYSRVFQAKTEIHPSLIGNLAVAVNDFSKELFDEFSGIQTIEQDNGVMIIHQADADIYYIALAYSESFLYPVILKEFANKTLEFFMNKKSKTYTPSEINRLDTKLDDVLTTKSSDFS